LFLHLKTFLGVQRFHNDEVKEAVNTGLHRRQHHSTMQGYKTGALLQQVPQQWWKLCQEVVYGMYLKRQYKWFGNKFLFSFNTPSELTFWITYVKILVVDLKGLVAKTN
jgi:tRNA A37 N6-isopentenylltransferase MiaA